MNKHQDILTNHPSTENRWILIIGVMLIGATLRVPLTSVGPLIPFIRDDLNINNMIAGFITTLPLLAFALFSPFAPKIANKVGMERTIGVSVLVLLIGMTVRSFTGINYLLIGTLLIGLAIAIGNVLIPAFLKINFPLKIGLMTGLYAVFMNVFGALGSGLSVPISSIEGIGWTDALFIWALLVLVAFAIWLPQLKIKRASIEVDVESEKRIKLWRSPIAWSVTIFMGGQSLAFYTAITWLPELLSALGYGASGAGWLVFLMQFSLIPTTFIVPMFAERMANQVSIAVGTAVIFMLSFLLLFINVKALAPIPVLLLGVASGSGFSLSMMFFSLRTRTGIESAELSGMAQSFGYLLAALGPVLVGLLYDIGNTRTYPLLFLICISIVIGIAGFFAGKEGKVTTNEAMEH